MYRRAFVIGFLGLFLLGHIQVAFSASISDIEGFDQAAARIQVVIEDETAAVDWVSVLRAVQRMGKLQDPRAEKLMVDILHRQVPLKLVEGAPLPGVMPPLEMLKAAAIDVLTNLDAKESVSEIQKIYEDTHFEVLKDMAADDDRLKGFGKKRSIVDHRTLVQWFWCDELIFFIVISQSN